MPFVQSGDSQIYYESHGSGFPLVFAHGVGGNHASWFYQVTGFSSDYRAIVFDHRGFGRSTDIEGIGRSGFVPDLAALINSLGLENCILVGQSMGGASSLGYTCHYPKRVRGLVLADTLVGCEIPDEISGFMQATRKSTANLSQADRVLGKTFRTQNPAMTQLYLELASFNQTTVKTLKGEERLILLEAIERTQVPILYVVGEEDILFPPEAIRAVHQRISTSTYAEIPGAGHSAYFEKPDVFNEILKKWIEQILSHP